MKFPVKAITITQADVDAMEADIVAALAASDTNLAPLAHARNALQGVRVTAGQAMVRAHQQPDGTQEVRHVALAYVLAAMDATIHALNLAIAKAAP